jgi:hypothetical protein
MNLDEIREGMESFDLSWRKTEWLMEFKEQAIIACATLTSTAETIGAYRLAGRPASCDISTEAEQARRELCIKLREQAQIYRDFAKRMDKEIIKRLEASNN